MLDEINEMVLQHDTRDLNEVDLYIQSIFKWFHEQGITDVKSEQVMEEMAKDNLPLVPDSFDINDLSDSVLQLSSSLVKTQFFTNDGKLLKESTETAISAALEFEVLKDGSNVINAIHLHIGIADIHDRKQYTNNI